MFPMNYERIHSTRLDVLHADTSTSISMIKLDLACIKILTHTTGHDHDDL